MIVRLVSFSESKVTVQVQGVPTFIRFSLDDSSQYKFSRRNIGSFLAIISFPFAARKSLDLEVPFGIPAELKLNLELLSLFWHQNRPKIFKKPIRISSSEEFSQELLPRQGSIVAFSGGVDSTYGLSSFIDSTKLAEKYYPKAAIMINGFGFELDEQQLFSRQYKLNEHYCGKNNIELISVKTNWKEVAPAYQIFTFLVLLG
ncbi:hypothetical protein [Psychrobacter sp. WY6]|uniref:hypothetical protein n=1 Tax=Psychrobacter sp. WY6 TaxID=2708350 RepID=UPI002022CB31|nr:hypothetical protein [Psychrobacter sp. WY6]